MSAPPAATPRILTFNFHEPYLCLMAKTGFHFTVGMYNDPTLARPWQTQYRAIPPNVTLVEEEVWRPDLEANRFHVAIAHNELNAANIFNTATPKLLVCHNRKKYLRSGVAPGQEDQIVKFDLLIEHLLDRFTFVFISESKRADYGTPGKVILPGIDVEEFGGYTGEVPEVLRVGNMMRERDVMFDVDFQEAVCQGFANRVVGDNPTIPDAKEAASFEELMRLYRTRRCLLHVSREEFEDGYNLSTLEAMACGMPVVSLANRTSPLTDGVDGFVSYDAEVLRERIAALFDDLDLAREIGARGRETVAQKFSIAAFVENWRNAIEEAAQGSRRATASHATVPPPASEAPRVAPMGIVLHYLASPLTTGRYLEQAARKRHNVVTAGLRCPEDVLERQGFGVDPPAYGPHDINLGLEGTCRQILDGLPEAFEPDVYLWVDSGPKKPPPDMEALTVPKACYLIDTHIAPELRVDIARRFDFTFLAQKGQVNYFQLSGIGNARWLPLACSPELHDVEPCERRYDVAHVGNPANDATDRRRTLLGEVARRFPNNRIGQFWPEDMARIYAQSRIVVNACVNRDVNMRVFEAMAAGALLITDEADGLEDLFEDGVHLVIYRDDADLLELIEQYLEDDAARQRIAAAGQALVRERHTYDLRIEELLHEVCAAAQKETPGRGPASTSGLFQEFPETGYVGESRFETGGYFRCSRRDVTGHVPPTVRHILDVGCGGGDFGHAMKRKGVEEVIGIEKETRAWETAKGVLDQAVLGDIETMELPFEDGHFDCITCLDVLEHLVDPAAVLRKASRVLAPDGLVIASIPNVQFYEVMAMLANGRWIYTDAGILDRTHLRFFTATDFQALLNGVDLEVLKMLSIHSELPKELPRASDGSLTIGRRRIARVTDEEYKRFLAYQYLVIAGKAGADRLARARQALDLKENQLASMLATHALGVDEAERMKILATATARTGQLDKAETYLRQALEACPDHAGVLAELGILLVGMNRPQEARPYIEQALEADPNDSAAAGALGLVHLTEGRAPEAYDALVGALEASFENAALLTHLIPVAAHLRRVGDIEALVRRYAEFYPGNAEVNVQYARLLIKLGRSPEARARLEDLLALDPTCEPARKLLDSVAPEGQ